MPHRIVIVVMFALLACKNTAPAPSASSTASATRAGTVNVRDRKPDLTVSIRDLLKDYAANEVAADAKYKGKTVAVIGYVAAINKDVADNAFVLLGTGKELEIPQAQLYFGDGAEGVLATLSKGQVVAAICRCDGLVVHVQLRDCALALNKDGGLVGGK